MITVRKLKQLLELCDDNRVVILSKDGEGNEFSPLAAVDSDSDYVAENTWSGELTDDPNDDSIQVVVLSPVN